MWHINEIVQAVNGTIYRMEREVFSGISTDTRTISEGELFIPLSGNNFDGHMFIREAYMKSHGGVLCERGKEGLFGNSTGTIVLVDNTLKALLDLARYRRKKLQGTFIAITGSNGKTTTKEILAAMMKSFYQVVYNEKNYNNLIGVSRTILSITGKPDFCIFELGTNSRGEIKQLALIIEPDISLITNIYPSHLEGLGSIEGIVDEKLDLFYCTKEGGRVFINADDPYILPRWKDLKHQSYTFGMVQRADFSLTIDEDRGWSGFSITLTFPDGTMQVRTNLLGRYNLYNILSASSIAYCTGLDRDHIKRAIETFNPCTMRFTPIHSRHGYTIIDDSYNANPSSMEWAIRILHDLPCTGKRVTILGSMKELGEQTAYYHKQLGRLLKESTISKIFLIGQEMRETFNEINEERAFLFEDKTTLIDYVKNCISEGDVILIKGSRVMKMEEIVEALI